LPSFGLFRKRKKQELQEQPQGEKPKVEQEQPVAEEQPAVEETSVEASPPTAPVKIAEEVKTYLKAMPLRELADLETVQNEVKTGNIIILRITPLASKSIEEVKQAVDQLYAFTESINGDIARLGEERVVICPEKIRIWREKAPAQNAPLPTAA
jgi:SepF-like predicted cell division protein (DUF552 family)